MEKPKTDENLAAFLGEMMEMRVSATDIKKCEPDLVQQIYIQFLRDIGASLEQINEVPFGVSEGMQQYPDMYRTVTRTMVLAKVIRYIFNQLFPDTHFMPADLYDPKPKRTRQFLWNIVDYYYVMRDRHEQLMEIHEEVQFKVDKLKEMQDKTAQLRERVQNLQLQDAETKILEEETDKRVVREKEQMDSLNSTKDQLKAHMDSLKLTEASLDAATKEAELQHIQSDERVKELRNQVVEDGEREEIGQRESRLTDLREALAEKKKRLEGLETNLASVQRECEATTAVINTLKELAVEIGKEKESMVVVSHLRKEKGRIHEEAEDRSLLLQTNKERLESNSAKVAQLHQVWQINKQSIVEEINQYKEAVDESRRNKTENEIVSQDLSKELHRINHQMTQFKEEIVKIDHFVATCYKEILDAIEENNGGLQVKLTEVLAAIEGHYLE